MLTDDEFRAKLRDILARSGLSMRALSAAFGRDPDTSRRYSTPPGRRGHARRQPISSAHRT